MNDKPIRYHARFDSLQGDRARSSNSVYFYLPAPGDDDAAFAFARALEGEIINGKLVSLNKNLMLDIPAIESLPNGLANGGACHVDLIFKSPVGQVEKMTLDYARKDRLDRRVQEIAEENGLVNRFGHPLGKIVKSDSRFIR